MNNNITEFLESLGADSQSEGEFTVSVEDALHKVESYSLADAGLFVVELLAYAVAGKASFFELETTADACRAKFDGEPPNPETLRNPLQALFSKATGRDLHLSLALLGARHFAESGAFLKASTGNLSLKDGEWTGKIEADGRAQTEFYLPRPYRLLSERFRRKPSLEDVMQVCRHAPLALRVNGRIIAQGLYASILNRKIAGRLVLQGSSPIKLYSDSAGQCVSKEIDREFSAVLTFADEKEAHKQGLSWIRNGISYKIPSLELGPCVCGYIVSSSVRRDLSGTGIVQDKSYREVMEIVNEECRLFLKALIKSDLRFRPATVRLRPAIKRLNSDESSFWLLSASDLESEKSRSGEPTDLIALLDEGKLKEAEHEALVQLSDLLEGLERHAYRPKLLQDYMKGQTWLEALPFAGSALVQARELHIITRFLTEGVLVSTEGLSQETSHLLARVQGRRQEALNLLPSPNSESFVGRMPRFYAETQLALGQFEAAKECCLTELGQTRLRDLGEVWTDALKNLTLILAQIAELEEKEDDADFAWSKLVDKSYCRTTNNLLAEKRLKQNRGRMSFVSWLQERVKISGQLAWSYLSFYRISIPKPIRQMMRGQQSSKWEPALEEFFNEKGHIYSDLFDFLLNELAQSLRKMGEHDEADELLSRAHLWVKAEELKDSLVEGRS